jgi:hypothetical protein
VSGLCVARVTSPALDLRNAVVNITSTTFRNIDTGVRDVDSADGYMYMF